jgi:hypothetical protein
MLGEPVLLGTSVHGVGTDFVWTLGSARLSFLCLRVSVHSVSATEMNILERC